ncbi:MAG: KH domain-containing protein [Candidatus Bathyarchaeia archaeon]|nr:RNA-processing protein [Candidatus Bathyarchaeota archaeon]
MERKSYIKIPLDRVGVLIGSKGRVKRRIERIFGVSLDVDSDSGSVEIALGPEAKDISLLFTVQNIVKAIGRGFNPRKAERLAEEDHDLLIIDLSEYCRTKNSIERVKGRIIGREGRARALLEELTETMISVYGETVSIIGRTDRLNIAREAIIMLVKGAFHKTVWNYLYEQRRRMKREAVELWEKGGAEYG